jgi:hypothetical protein
VFRGVGGRRAGAVRAGRATKQSNAVNTGVNTMNNTNAVLISDLAHLSNAVEFATTSLQQHPGFHQAVYHFANAAQVGQYAAWVTAHLPRAIIKINEADFIVSVICYPQA